MWNPICDDIDIYNLNNKKNKKGETKMEKINSNESFKPKKLSKLERNEEMLKLKGGCIGCIDIETNPCGEFHLSGHLHTPDLTSMYSQSDLDTTLKMIKSFDKLFSPAVRFIKETKKGEELLEDPLLPDENYPVKCYFNLEKLTTVLVFSDGSKFKITSDSEGKNKTAYNGIIIALAKRILGARVTINKLYGKFSTKTDAKTEAMFYGVVMGYFVTKGIVRDAEMFDKWMTHFLATRTTTHQKKVSE